MSFPNLPTPLAHALAERGYDSLTPVQEAVLAPDCEGRDLLVSAQTGSGKTVAYGLAMAPVLLGGSDRLSYAESPLALIIAPTRELALQVESELTWLYAGTGARIVSCVGGMDPIKERRQLQRGVHIVVGTPGRLRDHMERGALDLESLHAVVLDEADEMLDLGFSEDLKFLLDATPEERRTYLFSATLPGPIVRLARDYQNEALRLEIGGKKSGHADIEYRAIKIAHPKIDRAVVNLLRAFDPACALVFCATRLAVQQMGELLITRGFNAVILSGEMSQNERNRALLALREGRAKVCVATDVAARGLDVPSLSLVIHAELPKDAEILQHRSGRTGRAGKKGVSVLLVPPSRRRKAEMLLQQAGVQYSWDRVPSKEDIAAADREHLMWSPWLTEAGDTEDAVIAAALLERYEPHQIAAALSRLYRSALPEPEDVEEFVEDPRYADRGERGGRKSERSERPKRSDRPERGDRPERSREDRGERKPRQRREEAGDLHARLAERHGLPEGSVWFRISVGRERNADPKWLLPEICRQGEVTKKDIGQIRIFDRETRFELDARLADDFAARIAGREKGGVMIFPANGGEPEFLPPSEEEQAERRARQPESDAGEAPRARAPQKPWDKKAGGKKPWEKKGGKPGWTPKTDGRKAGGGDFVSKHDRPHAAKPSKPAKAEKTVRFSDHLADEERRAQRKERKKEKRKLKALAKG